MPRLRTDIWVQAVIRQCDVQMIPVAVLQRGDAVAGSVLLKIDRFDAGVEVLSRVTDPSGRRGWMRAVSVSQPGGATGRTGEDGPSPVEAYLARARQRDPDIWILEIEDRRGEFQPDGPLIG